MSFRTFVSAAIAGYLPTTSSAATEEQSGNASSALEQFKTFISSPPPIKNLLFQRKVPVGGGMRPLDGSFSQSSSFEYFQARWQTNGVLFRRLNSPNDAASFMVAGQLVSWSGHKHALFEPIPLLTTWDDRDPSVAGKEISIFYTTQFFLDPLKEILNLGIMHAGIGSARWEGNHFRAECELDHVHLHISGELFSHGNDPPHSLKVCYEFPGETHSYIIRYGYAVPCNYPFIPTTITNFWLSETSGKAAEEVELNEWQILDLEIASAAQSAEAFDEVQFANHNSWPTRVYKDNAFYLPAPDGTLKFAAMLGSRPSGPTSVGGRKVRFLYAGWAALNLLIFALMVRAKERESINPQKANHELQT